jgi:hypothetical protein
VRLVISDADEGLKGAIGAVLLRAAWQRCRVHFLRNVLARIPKSSAEMVLGSMARRCSWGSVKLGGRRSELRTTGASQVAPRFLPAT